MQRLCLHQTPIEDDAPQGALGYCPHLEEHSYPHAGLIKMTGSPRIRESSYTGGSGAGQHTEAVIDAPPYKVMGARVDVQSMARDSGVVSLWRRVHSVTQSDRLCESALIRVSLKTFQLGVGLVHPAPALIHERRRYPY